jgi:hypothetical protein
MSEAMFQHVRVSGKRFERPSIVLENMWFENCSFPECEVFYSGAQPKRSLAGSRTCAGAFRVRPRSLWKRCGSWAGR